MARRRIRGSDEDTNPNLTPMLDVVFIMLIFFIVTASFVKESGIEINRPSAQTANPKPKATILIALTEQGEVWIQKRPVDPRAVRANVERLRAENPQAGVVIQADRNSKNGLLVEVMDQVKLANVKNISIAADRSP